MSEPPAEPTAAPAPPAAPPDPVAPADLAPVPTRRERAAWYAGSMIVASVLVSAGLRLDSQDLHAPFYYDQDALLYLPLVKTTVEHGTHWRNERMGAPGIQELYDFPIIDYVHLGSLWLLSRVTPDYLVAYNLYNLLTYPLTVLTAMIVLRWLKLSLPAAAAGALLYAFLPYHQERYQYHYFLAAYWVVPLSLMPVLALCKGEFPFFRRGPDGTFPPLALNWRATGDTARAALRRDRAAFRAILKWAWGAAGAALRRLVRVSTLGYLLLGAATAASGAYYAFFACATYAFAGAYASVTCRTWRGAASAALVVAPVVAVGVALHYPTFAYQWKHGPNPITERMPEEAELYGLKLSHLLLPANDHNLTIFSQLRAMYSSPHRPVDSESAGSLGLIGGTGLLALLAVAVLPHGRRWPYGPLAGVVLFLVLLATVGGFGSLFNLMVTAQVRAYNRVSVFLGFFCLFAVLWRVDRFLLTRTGRRAKRLRYPAFALLFLIGFLDQTPYSWFKERVIEVTDKHAERFRADQRFFARVEAEAPGARVFCLPYIAFPESPPVYQMAAYEHARGYLMTDTLTWSFGAVKRRAADTWQREVAYKNPDEFLRRVVARGFDGLLIDGRGYPPRRQSLTKSEPTSAVNPIDRIHDEFAKLVNKGDARLPEVVHEDGRQFFLDLRPYRDALRALDPVTFARNEVEERERILVLWLEGFAGYDPAHDGDLHWGTTDATLVFVNPTDRARRVDFSFSVGVEVVGSFHFSFTGLPGLAGGEFDVEKLPQGGEADRARHLQGHAFHSVELPPGRSTLRVGCTPPPWFVPLDHRKLCYFITDFKLVEK